MRRRTGAALLCAIFLGACSQSAEEPSSTVLARWDGGEVHQRDLDRLVSSLPLDQRRPEDGDFDRWQAELVRELAVREILADEAESLGLGETAEFRDRMREVRRHYTVARYLRERVEAEEEPATRRELEEYLEAHREQYATPERRSVFHLYLRAESEEEKRRARERASQYRQRVLAGEPFADLAERHSDSMLRHRRGYMGWVVPGELAPAVERVVFDLEERVPSDPIVTRDGVHLFWVETILEQQTLGVDDVRGAVTAGLRQQRATAAIEALLEVELPPDSFVPDSDELAALLAQGEPDAIVVRVGDYTLRVRELGELLQNAETAGAGTATDASSAVDALVRRERLYLQALEAGLGDDTEIDAAIGLTRRAQLVADQRQARLEAYANGQEDRLRRLYVARPGRYSSPLRLRLRSLRVPLPAPREAARLMGRLENAAAAGTPSLEELAQETGGRLEDVGWVPAPGLAVFGRVGAVVAATLHAGETAAPFTVGGAIVVLQALEREDPEALEWEAARELVVRDLLEESGRELYEVLAAGILAEHDFVPVVSESAAGY